MTREHAHALLDAAKAGDDVSPGQINAALHATGDLECRLRSPVEQISSWPSRPVPHYVMLYRLQQWWECMQ